MLPKGIRLVDPNYKKLKNFNKEIPNEIPNGFRVCMANGLIQTRWDVVRVVRKPEKSQAAGNLNCFTCVHAKKKFV